MNDKQLQLILSKLETLAQSGVNVGSDIVRINAIGELIGGGIAAIIGLIATVVFVAAFARYKETEGEDNVPHIIFGSIFGLIGWMIALINLANVWNWVALSNSKLALAHQLFDKVMK